MTTAQQLRSSRIKLALILVLPLVAVGLATLVFYTGIGIPRATTNKGVLVQPPRQIDDVQLRTAAGQPWRHAEQHLDWSLLVVGSGPCAEACRERLYLTRQIRTALGRDADRLTRLYLQLDASPDAEFAAFAAREHPDLHVLGGETNELRALLARPGDPDPIGEQPLYVVDQRGFVMMYYLPRHRGRDTIDDLRFLLKYSNEPAR